jgi:hypothetical protein
LKTGTLKTGPFNRPSLPEACLPKPGLHSTANMKNPLPGQAYSEPFLAIRRPSKAVDRCIGVRRTAMIYVTANRPAVA